MILLGRYSLDKIGFNFQAYLERNYEDVKNVDRYKSPPKLESYNAERYGDKNNDPVPPLSNITAQFGEDLRSEIEEALDERVKDAISNCLS